MGCDSFIYEKRIYGKNSDFILRLKQTIHGWDFGEDLMDCLNSVHGYQHISVKQLQGLFIKHNIEPKFDLDPDKIFVVYVSY